MGKFGQRSRKGGNRSFGDRRGGQNFGGDRQMHQTTCSECGNICEVPFKPSSDKPVYCDDCFAAKRGGKNRGTNNRSRFERRSFGEKKNFEAICDACGQRCMVPFKPTSGKPVYCDDCFSQDNDKTVKISAKIGNDFEIEQLKTELFTVNSKLDRILHILNKSEETDDLPTKVEVEKPKAKKKAIKPKTKKETNAKNKTKKAAKKK